jgi:Resolvase, N terminal domain
MAAWSVDRLGRSLQELVGILSELRERQVDLYLHQQGLDTATPSGRAMYQMLGVFAEFERAIIIERIKPLFPRYHGLRLTLCADSGIRISSIDADGWARDGGRDG